MSIVNSMMENFVTEKEIFSPLMEYSKEAEEKLQRMGVINEKSEINDATIAIQASVFASSFNESILEFIIKEFELLDIAFDAFKRLVSEGELAGAYFYLLYVCCILECTVPYELKWIARREDALLAYLEKFIEAMAQYEVAK